MAGHDILEEPLEFSTGPLMTLQAEDLVMVMEIELGRLHGPGWQ